MTPRDALIELLERVSARHDATVLISEEELLQWPVEAVTAMRSHRLLVRARPAAAVVCPGCEEDCVMPVQTMPAGPRSATPFIVCDKRNDINRVALTSERVNQWKCDAAAIARFVARRLGLRRSGRQANRSGMLEIGLAAGDTRRQMLCLRTHEDVALMAGDATVPLADLVGFDRGNYAIDANAVRQLIDSTTTADPRYTPFARAKENQAIPADVVAAAERQLADVEAALTRLTTAVAAGGDVPALVEAIKAHEGQRVALERRLEALRRPPVTFDAALERRLQTAVAEWRNVLGRHVAQARQIVVKLLEGRLTFEPETRDGRRGFRFHAVGTVAKLVTGVVPGELSTLQTVASPTGFDPFNVTGGVEAEAA